MEKTFIYNSQNKKRIDKFLVEKIAGFSRSTFQKFIKEGKILVNQKRVCPDYLLKKEDIVEIKIKKQKELTPQKGEIEIIFENKNFLVINKPAGLIVHPTANHLQNTLVNFLLYQYPEIRKVGENKLRPGIVHRLDKDASGLLVIARNQNAFKHLKKQFLNHLVKKEYLILVYDWLKEKEGEISSPISRSKGLKMNILTGKKWRTALTKFQLKDYYLNPNNQKEKYSLVRVETKTGRTHQIRVHFKSIGHPIVGDKIYRFKKFKQPKNFSTLFLCAVKLGFFDLKNQWREFQISLPKNLKEFLKNLIRIDKKENLV